jgi:hypothetical protein
MAATNHTRPRTSRAAAAAAPLQYSEGEAPPQAAGAAHGGSSDESRPVAGADGASPDIDRPEAGDGGAAAQPLLDELADALGALRVIQRSLAARPQADALDEDALLQDVIDRLTDVHEDLDRFSMGVDPMSAPDDRGPSECGSAEVRSAGPEGGSDSEDVPSARLRCAALRRSLRDIERRLAVAYATCVTAEQALFAQNCEHDREIALCLRWGVSDAISQQQHRLRTIASSIPPDLAAAAPRSSETDAPPQAAHGTTASSSSPGDALGGSSEETPAAERP